MGVAITVAAGTALVGAGTAAYSAKKGRDEAKKGRESAETAEEARLSFEQQRYDEWNDVYGPMQSNLANYYMQLTPERYAAAGVEEFDKQFEVSLERLNTSLAQRGIADSGISASLEAQGELGAAEHRASIRSAAVDTVNEQKSNFVQIGLGQNPANNVGNAMGDTANSANQRARDYQNQANLQDRYAGQAIGSAANAVGEAIYAYNGRPQANVNNTSPGISNTRAFALSTPAVDTNWEFKR